MTISESKYKIENFLNSHISKELPIGLALLNNNFIFEKHNETYTKFLFLRTKVSGNILGKCYFDVLPGSQSQICDLFRSAMNATHPRETNKVPLKIVTHGEELISYWSGSLVPVVNSQHKNSGLLLCALDATEQVKIETTLNNLSIENMDLKASVRALMKIQHEDRNIFAENIVSNIKMVILPFLDKLKNNKEIKTQLNCIDSIESNLNNLMSDLSKNLISKKYSLSPRELQIANLIKYGRSTKEIAHILNISLDSVHTHRNHLRSKLGLKNKKTNLETFLSSLTDI